MVLIFLPSPPLTSFFEKVNRFISFKLCIQSRRRNNDRRTTFAYHCLIEGNGICITSVPIYRHYNSRHCHTTARMPILPKHR